ncbi:Hypothetical protein A7982_06587 [Minicystis rosea]|nr:Hypothetical protein A7982_06587 [Minicystis rosea]
MPLPPPEKDFEPALLLAAFGIVALSAVVVRRRGERFAGGRS